MMAIWMVAVVFGVVPLDSQPVANVPVPPAAATEQASLPARSGTELAKAAHETLRRWAKVADKEASVAAREFLAIYDELQRDVQLPRDEREQLRSKVRGRLAKLIPQLNKNTAADKRAADKGHPASVDAAAIHTPILGQIGGAGGLRGAGAGMAGPGGGAFGGGNSLVGDAGPDLVDLIQKTIAPPSWDVNGGPGAIYYWRPGMSIVVRQTDDVHEQLNDLLQQLQRAGQ